MRAPRREKKDKNFVAEQLTDVLYQDLPELLEDNQGDDGEEKDDREPAF